jgi:hypothetical protein
MNIDWNIVLVALSVSFLVVNVFQIRIKPFSCVPCLTAWVCAGLSFFYEASLFEIILYIPVGYFTGSLFEAIKMRWL